MPFAFPEYEYAYARFLHEVTHTLAQLSSPLLDGIEVEESSGPVGSIRRSENDADVRDLSPHSVGFDHSIDIPAVIDGDLEVLSAELVRNAEALAEGMVGALIETVGQVTEVTGNVVKGEGAPDFETIFAAMETLEMSVDDDGNLVLPTLVVHPDTAEKLRKLGDPTPEQEARLQELKERKRREALARRRRRRLA